MENWSNIINQTAIHGSVLTQAVTQQLALICSHRTTGFKGPSTAAPVKTASDCRAPSRNGNAAAMCRNRVQPSPPTQQRTVGIRFWNKHLRAFISFLCGSIWSAEQPYFGLKRNGVRFQGRAREEDSEVCTTSEMKCYFWKATLEVYRSSLSFLIWKDRHS